MHERICVNGIESHQAQYNGADKIKIRLHVRRFGMPHTKLIKCVHRSSIEKQNIQDKKVRVCVPYARIRKKQSEAKISN